MVDRILIRSYRYLAEQSVPIRQTSAFGYTIQNENRGNRQVQLLERHWFITDANGQRTKVQGVGVVGEQPFINPGECYAHQSGVQLKTPLGFMQGSYTFRRKQSRESCFDIDIPLFTLAIPHLIH